MEALFRTFWTPAGHLPNGATGPRLMPAYGLQLGSRKTHVIYGLTGERHLGYMDVQICTETMHPGGLACI